MQSHGEQRTSPPESGITLQAIQRAARAVAHPGGINLFEDLVRELASIMACEVAFIATFDDEARTCLHTLAAVADGRTIPNFNYAIRGTPCARVLQQRQLQFFSQDIPQPFPYPLSLPGKVLKRYAGYPLCDSEGSPLGILAAMGEGDALLADTVTVPADALMKIFAVRASAEIERERDNAELRSAALVVSSKYGESVLPELTRYMATILRMDMAFIALMDDAAPCELDMVALYVDGELHNGWRYTATGTPCEIVLAEGFQAFPSRLPETFPSDTDFASFGAEAYAGFPLRDRGGRTIGLIAGVSRRPITNVKRIESMLQIFAVRAAAEIERSRADLALRRSEANYRAIFETSEDAIVIHDRDNGAVIDVNPKACALFGYRCDELRGMSISQIISGEPPFTHEEAMRHVAEAKLGNNPVFEWRRRNRDGSLHWDLVRLKAVELSGRPCIVAFVREITGRKLAEAQREQLEAQLRQAQKMEAIGQLTGGIAHDFNNILTSVLGYTVLAAERAETLGDTRIQRQLEQAQRAAQRARDLIAQMLAFSRRQRSERRPVSLATLLPQSLRLLRSTLPSTIELESRLDADVPLVDADPVQIEQVLFNLCINARDAIDPPGCIRVALHEVCFRTTHPVCGSCRSVFSGRWVEFAITDTGSGIAPEILDRMFDPFFTTKEVGRGSGMGLAMVHGIVHEHGGHVLVETGSGDGRHGTRFRVCLPLSAAPHASVPTPGESMDAAVLARRGHVLVVEDEAMVGEFMTELLSGWGLEVTLHRDPREALRWFEQDGRDIDLVITDQTMPGLTGLELAARLTRLRPQLPVLLYTGYDEGIDDAVLTRHGICSLVRKPIEPAVLQAALRPHLAVL